MQSTCRPRGHFVTAPPGFRSSEQHGHASRSTFKSECAATYTRPVTYSNTSTEMHAADLLASISVARISRKSDTHHEIAPLDTPPPKRRRQSVDSRDAQPHRFTLAPTAPTSAPVLTPISALATPAQLLASALARSSGPPTTPSALARLSGPPPAAATFIQSSLGKRESSTGGRSRSLASVEDAMRLYTADGVMIVLSGPLRSVAVTRALGPLVQRGRGDGAMMVDASSSSLWPVLRYLALVDDVGVTDPRAIAWSSVARSVLTFDALSQAANVAIRCRLLPLADRLLRWRTLASQWTCPADRFTAEVIGHTPSRDALVVTAHAAAVTVDAFAELSRHIGQHDAERFALDSITTRRRDPAQRTVIMFLARIHTLANTPTAGVAATAKVDTDTKSQEAWLSVWMPYLAATQDLIAGSPLSPATHGAPRPTAAVVSRGMIARARAAVATTVGSPAAKATIVEALDCYERLCAEGVCRAGNPFHLYAALAARAAGWACAAAGVVLCEAVSRSPDVLGMLLDAQIKLSPSPSEIARHRVPDPALPTRHGEPSFVMSAEPRICIERYMADLIVARLGGSFSCDVGALVDGALRKHYGVPG